MFPRLPRAVYEVQKGEGNRRAFRRLVGQGGEPGILAYEERKPVGWCAIEPREAFPRLARSRLFRPVDDRPPGRSSVSSSAVTAGDRASRAR
jgi:hypothetical protein